MSTRVLTPHASRTGQRGAAALVVTMLLVFAMLLVVAVANRNAIVEARSSSNQYRSAQAFEAAEAGLEWALAKLNDPTPIGDDCLPSAAPGALPFRERRLRDDGAGFVPATWDDAGTATPLRAACVRGAAGWSCTCPAGGAALPALPAGNATAPAFSVEFAPGARPGLVRAIATGCTRGGAACTASSDADHEAAARVEVIFGLVPGLRNAPLAALTARGDVAAGAAALGLCNPDAASSGLVVHAGGSVAGDALRLGVPAGSTLEGAIVAGDASLSALTADRFLARWLGMDEAAWRTQPAATPIGGGASALASAVAAGARLLAVDGDLALDGPVSFGTPERPIVLVVAGALRLRGAVTLHGAVAAGSIDWRDAGAGALVSGALLTSGSYAGDAAADVVHDAALLDRLKRGSGSFARVNGSWKDF